MTAAQPTPRQRESLAAYVAAGGSISGASARLGIAPSTTKRHLADLRARFGLSTEELIYFGQAAGWLRVPSLEPWEGTDISGSARRVVG